MEDNLVLTVQFHQDEVIIDEDQLVKERLRSELFFFRAHKFV